MVVCIAGERIRAIAIALAVCLLGPAAVAAPAAGPGAEGDPGKRTAAQWAEEMARCIRTLRESNDPDTLVRAYRRGCGLDPKNVQLHDTYMHRMLRLGLLHVAYAPAETLRQLQPDNVKALATAGHFYATEGRMLDALIVTVRATRATPNDVSLQNNLGQLMAWRTLGGQDLEVPDDVRRTIDTLRNDLRTKATFRRAHARGRSVFHARANINRTHNKLIAPAKRAVNTAEKRYQWAQDAVTDKTGARPDEAQIQNLQKELAQTQAKAANTNRGATQKKLGQKVRELRERIRKLRAAGERSSAALRAAVQARDAASKDLQEKRAALKKLQAEKEKRMAAPDARWRWDPPTVDGKIMVVVTKAPGSKLIAAPGEEKEAGAKLKTAKLYLSNKLHAKAARILDTIVSLYPATDAAAEARQLLNGLPKGE